jgi:hypothetical protein
VLGFELICRLSPSIFITPATTAIGKPQVQVFSEQGTKSVILVANDLPEKGEIGFLHW